MAGPILLAETRDGVATIRLNRPDVHNAFDDVLIAELTGALRAVAADGGVRAVVLAATGKSFSAVADLNWMRRMAGSSIAENEADARALAELMRTLHDLAKPTVAVVQGPAYGGGGGLVAACDLALPPGGARLALSG